MFLVTDVDNRANLRCNGDFDWLQEQTGTCDERHLIIVIIATFCDCDLSAETSQCF